MPIKNFGVQIPVWTDCVFAWCKNQALNIEGLVMFLVVQTPRKTVGAHL